MSQFKVAESLRVQEDQQMIGAVIGWQRYLMMGRWGFGGKYSVSWHTEVSLIGYGRDSSIQQGRWRTRSERLNTDPWTGDNLIEPKSSGTEYTLNL